MKTIITLVLLLMMCLLPANQTGLCHVHFNRLHVFSVIATLQIFVESSMSKTAHVHNYLGHCMGQVGLPEINTMNWVA